LLNQVTESRRDGFEVRVTFNAVLTNPQEDSFSVFYGLDHSLDNEGGVSRVLHTLGN